MKRLEIVLYTYKAHLDDAALRTLAKEFMERGSNPGEIAHHERLDGRGGVTVQELVAADDLEASYERTLVYGKFMDFEVFPVTTIEDAVPTILRLYICATRALVVDDVAGVNGVDVVQLAWLST